MEKYILMILVSLCMVSCNSNKKTTYVNGEKQETRDTIFNDKIQGVFFDTPFGASKEEVIKNFKAHDLIFNDLTSSNALLHFSNRHGRFYTFGNLQWEMLDVFMSNGKFYGINFMNYSEDKAAAIESYDNILKAVSAKYYMMERESQDTTTYKMSSGYTKSYPRRVVTVACYRYESISKKILQGISLTYYDEEFESEVSDEL